MSVPVLIALGGNLGDVRATFEAALRTLHAAPGVRVTAASRPYRTPAVGADAGGEFLNAAATLETTLSPQDLLGELHRAEETAGRERTRHWGPRPLDLDLILYGEASIDGDRLTVPHPGLQWRRFVLDPACEVAADWWVWQCRPLRELRERLLERPLKLVAPGDADVDALLAELEAEFPGRVKRIHHIDVTPANLEVPTLCFSRPGYLQADLESVTELPTDLAAVRSLLQDIVSAALPDPEPEPVGEPLWPL